MHGEVHVSVHVCPNDYLRCTKCEVHKRVHKHVIRCIKKRVPRFLILEALTLIAIALGEFRSPAHYGQFSKTYIVEKGQFSGKKRDILVIIP